jgi:transposase
VRVRAGALRAGPAGQKKYVRGAFTELYSLFFLGKRNPESFRDFGILPDFAGIVVSDWYACYFHDGWEHLAGHQPCLAHILRDYQDAAESWPDAIWPGQAQRALRGLIKAWHDARGAGKTEIPEHVRGRWSASSAAPCWPGCPSCPASPGRRTPPPSTPGVTCWSSAATGKRTSCGSPPTPGSAPQQHQRAWRAPDEFRDTSH